MENSLRNRHQRALATFGVIWNVTWTVKQVAYLLVLIPAAEYPCCIVGTVIPGPDANSPVFSDLRLGGTLLLQTTVVQATYRNYIQIIFLSI